MRGWLAVVVLLAGGGCAPDDSHSADDGGSPDAGDDRVPPADDAGAGDAPGLDDGGSPDPGVEDSGTEDTGPSATVCRYECEGDDECRTVYGAGWVCRELTATGLPYCLRLCGADADCRFGAASDPLMVCRGGTCGMRPCTGDGECGWVGTGGACLAVSWGTMRGCRRSCSGAADCGTGAATDVLWRCAGGLCEWSCSDDAACRTAFGSSEYGCRTPTAVPGPSCVHACASREECLVGGVTDVLADCR